MSPAPARPTDQKADPLFPLFCLLFAVIFIAVVGLCARETWAMVVYRLLVDGPFVLAWLVAGYGIGATMFRLLRINDTDVFAVASMTGVGFGLIGLLMLGLGLIGWLNSVSAYLILLFGIAGASPIAARAWKARRMECLRTPSWCWLVAAVPIGLVLVGALLPPGLLWGDEPNGYDVVEYHLQVPREWYEIGRIVPLQHNVFSYFPFNVEMHSLLAMHLRAKPATSAPPAGQGRQ